MIKSSYSKNDFNKTKIKNGKKETEYSKRQYSLFPNDANEDKNYQKQKSFRQIYDEEIADQLRKLDIIKPISIYSSIKKLGANADTPLIYI
ncbi:hypothetical protein [Bartonella sp. C271]|uniref:hypothetical protein n=1 Tax=Bartonella sp. C271 TaxID=3070220 RepID=UPI0038B61C20